MWLHGSMEYGTCNITRARKRHRVMRTVSYSATLCDQIAPSRTIAVPSRTIAAHRHPVSHHRRPSPSRLAPSPPPTSTGFPLPPELIIDISSHLQIPDLNAFIQTCRQTHKVLNKALYRTVMNPVTPMGERLRDNYLLKATLRSSPGLTRLLTACPDPDATTTLSELYMVAVMRDLPYAAGVLLAHGVPATTCAKKDRPAPTRRRPNRKLPTVPMHIALQPPLQRAREETLRITANDRTPPSENCLVARRVPLSQLQCIKDRSSETAAR